MTVETYLSPVTNLPNRLGEVFSDRGTRIYGRAGLIGTTQIQTSGLKFIASPIDGGSESVTIIPDGTYTIPDVGGSLWGRLRRTSGTSTLTLGVDLLYYASGTQPKPSQDWIQVFYRSAAAEIVAPSGFLVLPGATLTRFGEAVHVESASTDGVITRWNNTKKSWEPVDSIGVGSITISVDATTGQLTSNGNVQVLNEIIGGDITLANNPKLHRGAQGLQVVPGNDSTADGANAVGQPFVQLRRVAVASLSISALAWDKLYSDGALTTFSFPYTDVNIVTDAITKTSHGLAANQAVILSSDGYLPGEISAATIYYVRDVTASTFKLALSPGGGVVDITSQGTGTHTLLSCMSITLPTSPNMGDEVEIFDAAYKWESNPIIILRNGKNIESLSEDLLLNIVGEKVRLLFYDNTQGWRVF